MRKHLFNRFAARYDWLLRNHIASDTSNDFIYREFAFTILSLADGDFSLLDNGSVHIIHPGMLTVHSRNIRYDRCSGALERMWVGCDSGAIYIPAFGHGADKRNVAPGSAPPTGSSFWFNGAVVHLAGLTSAQREPATIESAMSEAICFVCNRDDAGHPLGTRRSFYGVVFALSRMVLIRGALPASSTSNIGVGVVTHTSALPLLSLLWRRQCGHHPLNPGAGATFAGVFIWALLLLLWALPKRLWALLQGTIQIATFV
jgi:hypothetical protein